MHSRTTCSSQRGRLAADGEAPTYTPSPATWMPRPLSRNPANSQPVHGEASDSRPGLALLAPSLEADLFCDDDRVECRAAKKLVAAHK
mmetsp:Transcript_32284/g.104286  ORF Transcript_32284/g.104286 Transcript_32284/m.104286 type:complete len:88 (-) Transcript_32284:608-871(-)